LLDLIVEYPPHLSLLQHVKGNEGKSMLVNKPGASKPLKNYTLT
jgi:hypothetical protein